MSQWVHVRGTLVLHGESIRRRKTRTGKPTYYFPYPEEQCSLYADYVIDNQIQTRLKINSYPLVSRIIKEGILDYIPFGETGTFCNLSYDTNHVNISSSQLTPQEQPIFRKLASKQLNGYGLPWNMIKKRIACSSVDYNNEVILTINDDIRYCSGNELMTAFYKLFDFLSSKNIYIKGGYIEWVDEWEWDKIFAIRVDEYDSNIKFMILNSKTNSIKSWKNLHYKYDYSNNEIIKDETQSKNWDNDILNVIIKEN